MNKIIVELMNTSCKELYRLSVKICCRIVDLNCSLGSSLIAPLISMIQSEISNVTFIFCFFLHSNCLCSVLEECRVFSVVVQIAQFDSMHCKATFRKGNLKRIRCLSDHSTSVFFISKSRCLLLCHHLLHVFGKILPFLCIE